MNQQKWFHEYWFFMARSLLEEVQTKYSDFPLAQLSHAAQTKSDWEAYLWHWAMRKMLAQADYSDLLDSADAIAKARVGLAAIHAICRYGLLMENVDATKTGRLISPTISHTINAIRVSFGNANYDPASVERDETKRSRLMVEVFDNYLKLGHNWHWERSRNWAYLSRVSANVPTYTCDSCGRKLTRDGQMWRCSRCGKATRPAIPGTFEVVEPHECLDCGYRDQYRVSAIQCPSCYTSPDGRYRLTRSWNSPTFARRQQGMKNAQKTHKTAEAVFASSSVLPTKADRQAYEAWVAASPSPERVPSLHQMELEAHEVRLRAAAIPNDRQPQRN